MTTRPRPPGSARAVALEAVRRVADEGAYSNLVVPSLLERSGLPRRDRELAAELSYGTLRRLLPIDRALEPLVDRPLGEAPPRSRAALRIGAYQVLFTRVPDHAAVAETVRVLPTRARGFVNAVLRRLATAGAPPPRASSDESVSDRMGLAPWAAQELRRLLGDEADEAAAALASPAPLTVRANECRATVEDVEAAFRRQGLRPERGRLHPGSLRLSGGSPSELPGYGRGLFAVQDEASAWVVDALAPRPGERVLDACAAPGGKAAHIACRAGGVVAADVGRLGLVAETARRLGAPIVFLAQDARRPALRPGFDRVLVDAPCSGIGAARRRPELLWRPRREDVGSLARLQLAVAGGAASLLRTGGILVYSVCTFPAEETDGVCDRLLEAAPELVPEPFPGPEGDPVPRARLWPHRHGTDAMFVARFRRA